jgi:hypothetical protein
MDRNDFRTNDPGRENILLYKHIADPLLPVHTQNEKAGSYFQEIRSGCFSLSGLPVFAEIVPQLFYLHTCSSRWRPAMQLHKE